MEIRGCKRNRKLISISMISEMYIEYVYHKKYI